jgi:glycosyltransferase involved in cell wall biosynthesis
MNLLFQLKKIFNFPSLNKLLSTRLAVITTHPVQYYAPLFKLLTERKKIEIKIFYTWGSTGQGKIYDPGFGKLREWDLPLLEGYDYEFIQNISSKPGSHHFTGINNPTLITKIKDWNASAVLIIGWNFLSHLKVMYYFKGKIPVLFRGDSTLLDEPKRFNIKKIVRRFSLSVIYRYIDHALYVGTNNKAYFSAMGVSEDKLVFAPHAIDNDRFTSSTYEYDKQALEWKKQLNIPMNKLVVLFAGKLEPKKNPLLLIDAARAFSDIHFIIVGNGTLETIIKAEISNIENITLLPFQNQSKMPVVYRLADIFVLPSKGPGETWGLAINEAMASGRLVIASNKCGGAIDLIENGENGFIIEPELQSFIEVLDWARKSFEQITAFKQSSRDRIEEFTLKKLSKTIEECSAILQSSD